MFARRATLTGATLLVLLGLLALVPMSSPAAAEPRTWVVDAVDDASGNRWESADTGGAEITVQPGDTVEWRFDRALIEHDLTSEDSRSTWAVPVQEYRAPGGEPVRRTFTEPGEYWFLCSLHGVVMRGVVRVGDPGDGEPPTGEPPTGEPPAALPEVSAHAHHADGSAPLPVAFSTEVGTDGTFAAYADGLASHPDLAGTARLVRSRGQTLATLDVTGLTANASHLVHVHEQACDSSHGGAHFRFDEGQPFAEANEIWLPFTSDATGASGPVTVTQPIRAGAKAVSIVIHDPVNPAQRIGCANLSPDTADLTYAWEFGDGGTASVPDPDHTYAAAGTHTATVTVSRPGGATTASSVDVVVDVPVDAVAPQTTLVSAPSGTVRTSSARFRLGSSEPGTFRCRLDDRAWAGCPETTTFGGLRDGPHLLRVQAVDLAGNADPTPAWRRWVIDTRGPAVTDPRPTGRTRDRTPLVGARVVDRWSAIRAADVLLRVDGRPVAVRYDARRDLVRWQPRRALAPGWHRARLVVRDAIGNATVRTWAFRVRR